MEQVGACPSLVSFLCTHRRPGQSDTDVSERRENVSHSPGVAERHGFALDSWTSRPPRNTMRNMCTDNWGRASPSFLVQLNQPLFRDQNVLLLGILLQCKKYNSVEQTRTTCVLRCWLNCQMASIEALLSVTNRNSTIPRRRGSRPLFASCHVSLPHNKQTQKTIVVKLGQFPRMIKSNWTKNVGERLL